jgi:NADH-quinone oxidoreductase subunit K
MEHLTVSLILFCIGLYGALSRKNAIAILMAIELMLNAVNLNLLVFSKQLGDVTGQVFALFVIAMAAAEVTTGLAIIINLYRQFREIDVEKISLLKW